MIVSQGDPDPSVPAPQDPPQGGPMVLRIALGTQLRRLREAKGISRRTAAYTIRASQAKISRVESGKVGFKQRDVADLLTLYGVVDAQEREVMSTLAREASSPGWWRQYKEVLPNWFQLYVGLEQAASVIRTYQVQFVPGLFQTEDYARSVARLAPVEGSATDVDRRVSLRVSRQELLAQGGGPRVWAVMDEAAVRRMVGGRRVMRAQLERLLELTELPNVTVQIIPFEAGGHAAAGGSFSIMRFAAPDLPDVAYLEQLTTSTYLDKSVDVTRYLMVMDRLCAKADSLADTKTLLARIIDEIQ